MKNLLTEMKNKLTNVEGAKAFYNLLDELQLDNYTEITKFSDENIYYTVARFVLDDSIEILLQYEPNFYDYDDKDLEWIPNLIINDYKKEVA
ncbi:hypothetical protein H8891_06210 [Paeniclostridium sp. NSJ-45]|uniref:Phage protein n=1 Tax=Paeniclostridium hominis TaxID=2764329 RepID=A0ABR7K2R6_9FIRM|nr:MULTISPECIES: hypothetical protein [Paeniclostridium]MBC6003388.1 hypothetical protein [Paeniclostridium hominis]